MWTLEPLEAVVQVLAEHQVSLQKLIAQLATETRRGFEQVAQQFAETDRRMEQMRRETDARFRETDERFRRTDQRIDNLASAIGEWIRRQDASRS